MAKAIKLSDELIEDAKRYASVNHRSPPKQIEHWAAIGKIAEETPDLPLAFVSATLISLEEMKSAQVSEYEFDE